MNTVENTIYRRTASNWIGSTGGKRSSVNYWRQHARKVFRDYPTVEAVEIVHTGRKSDSGLLRRGADRAPAGFFVTIASTGGAWGKSRRDYPPAS
jgi:hypothetical protein